MKRKSITLVGNALMGLGLVGMVGGVAVTLLSYMPTFSISEDITHGALAVLFCGALTWLVGARISGYERVEDRYWYLRRNYKRRHRPS